MNTSSFKMLFKTFSKSRSIFFWFVIFFSEISKRAVPDHHNQITIDLIIDQVSIERWRVNQFRMIDANSQILVDNPSNNQCYFLSLSLSLALLVWKDSLSVRCDSQVNETFFSRSQSMNMTHNVSFRIN